MSLKKISSLFNITRIYNACSAVAYMRRALALARDYAQKRKAFGRLLSEHGLHLETLAQLQVEFEAAFHLVFHTIELLGKDELGEATLAESAVLRLLTPLIKLYTAKQAIAVVSEALEAFGGAGYIEDTGLPQLLRDAQVLSIWEGTTNVLSLDALRAIRKEEAAEPFLQAIEERLAKIHAQTLGISKERTAEAVVQLKAYMQLMLTMSEEEQQLAARHFAFSMIQTYAASLLLEHAEWALQTNGDSRVVFAAQRWCAKELTQLLHPSKRYCEESRRLALELPEST